MPWEGKRRTKAKSWVDRNEGILGRMRLDTESYASQEGEVELNEEGNRKLRWVLIEKVTERKGRPSQGCSQGVWTLISL